MKSGSNAAGIEYPLTTLPPKWAFTTTIRPTTSFYTTDKANGATTNSYRQHLTDNRLPEVSSLISAVLIGSLKTPLVTQGGWFYVFRLDTVE